MLHIKHMFCSLKRLWLIKACLLIVLFFQQKVLVVTQSEVQHIIQERMKELQELKHNVDVLKVRSDSS